jgi:unsaturated rhamnogalacturonyl hydrolase
MKFCTLILWVLLLNVSVFAQENLLLSVRMANSEMKRNPSATTIDGEKKLKWNYTQGLVCKAMEMLWLRSGDQKYYDYAKAYADSFINVKGEIFGYKADDYSLDRINSGKILFYIYHKSGDKKYLAAINLLRDQLKTQPRTTEGGYWHKKGYTNQMWLDGIYMASPFLAEYAALLHEDKAFDEVVNQVITIHKHTFDAKTGLNYHGWDESKSQKWANPETGCSPHFWGRAMGWYMMAIVDILDFLPENHPKRTELLQIFETVAKAVVKYQHPEKGVWFQVLDRPAEKGNYAEASCSAMFTYSLYKGVRKGFLDKSYLNAANTAFEGMKKEFVQENADGTISLTKVCNVAGLGGKPYRSGTYEYYISEPVIDNDPKGVGPFIMACLENEWIKP